MKFYTNVSLGRNVINYRGVEDGKRVNVTIKYSPSFYEKTSEKSKYKTIYGDNLAKKRFKSIAEAGRYINKFKDVDNYNFYGLKSYSNQYIHENFINDIEYDEKYISIVSLDIETECENGFPDVSKAEEEITCLTLYSSIYRCYFVFSNKERGELDKDYFRKYKESGEKIKLIEAKNECEMLRLFLHLWSKKLEYPDIITGWNINGFDIPFLINRLYRVFGEDYTNNHLSAWGKITSRERINDYGHKFIKFTIEGTSILDYLEIYKSIALAKQESYKLDHVVHVELGEAKLDYGEHGNMRDFYLKDYAKFVEYNLKDVWLINRLEEKLGLLQLSITLAYMAKVNFEDIFSSVKLIESLCYSQLYKKNIIMEIKKKKQSKTEKYLGAYVKNPQKGLHDWVASFDLNSLYPSIILALNISPETLREKYYNKEITINKILNNKVDLSYLKKYNITYSCNGHHFSREKTGFIPEIVEMLIVSRKAVKNEMLEKQSDYETLKKDLTEQEKVKRQGYIQKLHLKQWALKVLNNSIYGAMGNEYFAYYDVRLASAITHQGQYIIKYIEKELNKYMNKICQTKGVDYIIYMDTDSIYVSLDRIVKDFSSKKDLSDNNKKINFMNLLCEKKIEPFIEKSYNNMAEKDNLYKKSIVMKREVLASRGIWKAKKMYALMVYDNEHVRYLEPKMKIMGLETQRSSSPAWAKEHLKEAVKLLLTKDEVAVQNYITKCKKEFETLSVEEIAFPRGANNIEKWIDGKDVKLGTPIHIKASIYYNNLVKKHKLENKYYFINSGEKMKYVYLQNPNPEKISVIGFIDEFPKEFSLSNYVDFDMMFDKTFLTPLKNLMDVVGWECEKTNTLDDLFV